MEYFLKYNMYPTFHQFRWQLNVISTILEKYKNRATKKKGLHMLV